MNDLLLCNMLNFVYFPSLSAEIIKYILSSSAFKSGREHNLLNDQQFVFLGVKGLLVQRLTLIFWRRRELFTKLKGKENFTFLNRYHCRKVLGHRFFCL